MAEYGIETVPDGMPDDPGNSDKIAPTVADSIAAAMARGFELQGDTYGVVIGDAMPLAGVLPDLDPGVNSLATFDQKPGVEG